MRKSIFSFGILMLFTVTAHGRSGFDNRFADPGDLNTAPNGPSLNIPNGASPSDQSAIPGPTKTALPVVVEPSNLMDSTTPESISIGTVFQPDDNNESYLFQDRAEVVDSGSWLQRGYWYTEQDFVVYVRSFHRDSIFLAGEAVSGLNRSLDIRTAHPAAMANVRITLGRFLFRDEENRDHTFECTVLGLGQEVQEGTVVSLLSNNLFVDPGLTRGNTNFGTTNFNTTNGSDIQTFNYKHEMNSLEFNYHIKGRMKHDQMVLKPNGRWYRRATASRTNEFIFGLRYFALDEWLDWDATDDQAVLASGQNSRSGQMRIKTTNDLVGFQFGGAHNQNFGRFSLGVRGKAGVYVNFARMNRGVLVNEFTKGNGGAVADATTALLDDTVTAKEEAVGFVGEASVTGRYHLRQNLSLRLSGELLFITRVATAPTQISFVEQSNILASHGENFYIGFGAGLEGYW